MVRPGNGSHGHKGDLPVPRRGSVMRPATTESRFRGDGRRGRRSRIRGADSRLRGNALTAGKNKEAAGESPRKEEAHGASSRGNRLMSAMVDSRAVTTLRAKSLTFLLSWFIMGDFRRTEGVTL